MTASTEPSFQPPFEEQGATLRALQPMYAALVREFVIEVSTCPVDEEFSPSPESVEHAEAWFQQVDAQIQVHQLRQFLQTTPLANEAVLRHLLLHHMQKTAKSSSDRDKTDFLLVQYFSLCAPSGLEDADLDLDYVAQVLEPVLGPQQPTPPAWLSSLETILQSAARCHRLSELLHSGALEQGRKLKTQSAERYFEPSAMVVFARFSFMIRRIFFRLMHDDLNAIQDGLRELERRGVTTIDCRRAQFSFEEPTGRLRMICQSWKVMFHAEYSSGQPLRMLVDLRAAVDDALQNDARKHPLAASAASGTSGGGTTT
ncbi:MAG TPA: hypothetical protein VE957_07540 [Terriglobales bacterium]|jgi:hypothetical protein|nr:hypothetical protein [Terriglobales bacterium]